MEANGGALDTHWRRARAARTLPAATGGLPADALSAASATQRLGLSLTVPARWPRGRLASGWQFALALGLAASSSVRPRCRRQVADYWTASQTAPRKRNDWRSARDDARLPDGSSVVLDAALARARCAVGQICVASEELTGGRCLNSGPQTSCWKENLRPMYAERDPRGARDGFGVAIICQGHSALTPARTDAARSVLRASGGSHAPGPRSPSHRLRVCRDRHPTAARSFPV